jgi:hypothetical protein
VATESDRRRPVPAGAVASAHGGRRPTGGGVSPVAAADGAGQTAVPGDGGLTHSGELDLSGHIGNACVKVDARGRRVVKEHKMSKNRIDLAIAAIMAHSIAVAPAAPQQMFVFDGVILTLLDEQQT